jgi:prepilin-type N-terminal cleavage/methylation domain-containing protein
MTRKDDGFTLIELLVAIVIMGVISLPLSAVVVDYLRNTTSTAARLTESHDAQISAAYWAQDVASIGTRGSAAPTAALLQSVDDQNSGGWPYPCAQAGTTPVIRFVWTEFDSSGSSTQVRVAYVTATVSGQQQLLRLHCSGGSSTPDSSAVMAHVLSSAGAPACSTGGSAVPCTGAGSSVPTTISLALTIKDPQNSGAAYNVTLTGQRRQT